MSLPLRDFRTGISGDALAALKARAYAENISIQEMGRKVIEDWAYREIHAAKVLQTELLLSNGGPEPRGMRRNGGVE